MGLPLRAVLRYLLLIMMELKKYSMIQPSDEPSVCHACNKSQVGISPFHICVPTVSENIMTGLCNQELIGNKIRGSNIAMLEAHGLCDIIFMSIFTPSLTHNQIVKSILLVVVAFCHVSTA